MRNKQELSKIDNEIIRTIYEFCEFMRVSEDGTKFNKGYNYALMLLEVKLSIMNKSIKEKQSKEK